MPIQHTNRKGQTFYLHQGNTKTGKLKYFFAMKDEGALVDTIPDGFEIYENPNAQVFLRRIQPKLITDDEMAIVEKGMKQFSHVTHYCIDVKKDTIIVFLANQDVDGLSELFNILPNVKGIPVQDFLNRAISYSPMLQFVLVDQERRVFITQRYCFLGSIDDWIDIGRPDTLPNLVKAYVKHLGQESYYELM